MLCAQRFPQDTWEAAGIIFLGRFCCLGPSGSLDSHSVSATCHPFPPHTRCTQAVATGQLSCRVLPPLLSRDPIFLPMGLPSGRAHPEPIELESSLDLNCHLCWVPGEHSKQDSTSTHPLYLVGSFLFPGNRRVQPRANWGSCGRASKGSSPLPCPTLPFTLLSVSLAEVGLGGGWYGRNQCFNQILQNVLFLCTITILCKDEICVELKIVME